VGLELSMIQLAKSLNEAAGPCEHKLAQLIDDFMLTVRLERAQK
jgi:hypothetical protein